MSVASINWASSQAASVEGGMESMDATPTAMFERWVVAKSSQLRDLAIGIQVRPPTSEWTNAASLLLTVPPNREAEVRLHPRGLCDVEVWDCTLGGEVLIEFHALGSTEDLDTLLNQVVAELIRDEQVASPGPAVLRRWYEQSQLSLEAAGIHGEVSDTDVVHVLFGETEDERDAEKVRVNFETPRRRSRATLGSLGWLYLQVDDVEQGHPSRGPTRADLTTVHSGYSRIRSMDHLVEKLAWLVEVVSEAAPHRSSRVPRLLS